ncbi:MAG: hypothetical protein QXR02_04735 [Acidilobaceae archaeon]
MSSGIRAIIRTGFGKARYSNGEVDLGYARVNIKDISIDSVLSVIAACFTKSIVESLKLNGNIEVLVSHYTDLDAILDGRIEDSEYLTIEARGKGLSRSDIEKALANCPLYNMLKSKVRDIRVQDS